MECGPNIPCFAEDFMVLDFLDCMAFPGTMPFTSTFTSMFVLETFTSSRVAPLFCQPAGHILLRIYALARCEP